MQQTASMELINAPVGSCSRMANVIGKWFSQNKHTLIFHTHTSTRIRPHAHTRCSLFPELSFLGSNCCSTESTHFKTCFRLVMRSYTRLTPSTVMPVSLVSMAARASAMEDATRMSCFAGKDAEADSARLSLTSRSNWDLVTALERKDR